MSSPLFSFNPFPDVGNAPSAIRKVIQQQLMPAVVAYYQAALKVNRVSLPITYSDADVKDCTKSSGLSSNDAMRNGVETDLLLLITGANEPNEGYVAYAYTCDQAEDTGRFKNLYEKVI